MNNIKGEENVAADTLSRIPWQVAIPKAFEIIQLAGEIERDPKAKDESQSASELEGEEILQEDSVAQGEVILLGFEMRSEHPQGAPDCQSLVERVNATGTPTGGELEESSPYLRVLTQHTERITEVDEMLVIRVEVDRTNRVFLPNVLICEVIEEEHQGLGTAQGGAKKMMERLMHSSYWPGMMKDVPKQFATCSTSDKFHNPSKR